MASSQILITDTATRANGPNRYCSIFGCHIGADALCVFATSVWIRRDAGTNGNFGSLGYATNHRFAVRRTAVPTDIIVWITQPAFGCDIIWIINGSLLFLKDKLPYYLHFYTSPTFFFFQSPRYNAKLPQYCTAVKLHNFNTNSHFDSLFIYGYTFIYNWNSLIIKDLKISVTLTWRSVVNVLCP